jgi:hypothetical protein
VILGNNYDGDEEKNNNGDTRDMVSACDVVSLMKLRKSKNCKTEGI